MAFIVIYDANALYPNTLRDLLIRIAQQPHAQGIAGEPPGHHGGEGSSPT
jgi:hypothetical protein